MATLFQFFEIFIDLVTMFVVNEDKQTTRRKIMIDLIWWSVAVNHVIFDINCKLQSKFLKKRNHCFNVFLHHHVFIVWLFGMNQFPQVLIIKNNINISGSFTRFDETVTISIDDYTVDASIVFPFFVQVIIELHISQNFI
eukprot:Pompholyxophrys_punicea_v1_NODE_583_length_1649_cov_4.335006.p3 type:complete len:140 gc:universal NODE_583_length_1649_cov_4.335006:800-381(-)